MITAKALLVLLLNNSMFDYAEIDVDEAYCMAQNIWHEARAEDIEGQFAVAHATIERVNDDRFPNTVCGVVLDGIPDPNNPTIPKKHKCAFSWNCDRKSDEIVLYHEDGKPNLAAIKTYSTNVVVSFMALSGEVENFCDGANYYYNPSLADPAWAKYYTETCEIGNHVFLRREVGSKL